MKAKTYLPLFSGFYNSHWSEPCFDGEEDIFDLPKDKEFWEFVDWNRYYNHISRQMCNEVQYLLSDFVSHIEFERLVSPKYYNFSDDTIYCEITFNKTKVKQYLKDNYEKFSEYIKHTYTSRDGFISYHSNDPKDWMNKWNEHQVGSILQFICENERFEEPWDITDSHVSLFYNQEINQYERTNFSD
jgi:hypothetical protein